MPIKAGGNEVTALKRNGVAVQRAKYNGIEVFTAFRVPDPITFTITAGFSSSLIGYWAGRAGSISNANIVTTDGDAATVRQLNFGSSVGFNELRLTIRQPGLTVNDADQFPVEIRIVRGSSVGVFVAKETEDIRATSDGIARDYVAVTGSAGVSSVIVFSQTSTVTIQWTLSSADQVPTFGSATVAAQSWMQNREIAALVLPAATGGDGTLTYSISPALPAGLTFTPSTRTISGTPTVATARAFYAYQATDEDGDVATLNVSIAVAADPTPSFGSATIAAQSWMQNTAITDLVLPAATGGDAPLTYSLSPALPAGLTFTAATRTISGTPSAAAAEATYTYTVTDADGDTDTIQFAITVAAVASVTINMPSGVNRGTSPRGGMGSFAFKRWTSSSAGPTDIPDALKASPSGNLYISQFVLWADGYVSLQFAGAQFPRSLSDAWESGGTMRVQIGGGIDFTLNAPGATQSPYDWPAGTITTQQYNSASGRCTITLSA